MEKLSPHSWDQYIPRFGTDIISIITFMYLWGIEIRSEWIYIILQLSLCYLYVQIIKKWLHVSFRISHRFWINFFSIKMRHLWFLILIFESWQAKLFRITNEWSKSVLILIKLHIDEIIMPRLEKVIASNIFVDEELFFKIDHGDCDWENILREKLQKKLLCINTYNYDYVNYTCDFVESTVCIVIVLSVANPGTERGSQLR